MTSNSLGKIESPPKKTNWLFPFNEKNIAQDFEKRNKNKSNQMKMNDKKSMIRLEENEDNNKFEVLSDQVCFKFIGI